MAGSRPRARERKDLQHPGYPLSIFFDFQISPYPDRILGNGQHFDTAISSMPRADNRAVGMHLHFNKSRKSGSKQVSVFGFVEADYATRHR